MFCAAKHGFSDFGAIPAVCGIFLKRGNLSPPFRVVPQSSFL